MVRLAVENDVLAEDGGTGAEIIAPNLIAQNGDMALAGMIFFGRESAAQSRLGAEDGEEA